MDGDDKEGEEWETRRIKMRERELKRGDKGERKRERKRSMKVMIKRWIKEIKRKERNGKLEG